MKLQFPQTPVQPLLCRVVSEERGIPMASRKFRTLFFMMVTSSVMDGMDGTYSAAYAAFDAIVQAGACLVIDKPHGIHRTAVYAFTAADAASGIHLAAPGERQFAGSVVDDALDGADGT